MTVELLGVAVEVEVVAALLVTPEKSPVVNVAKDIGILLKLVAELFIPSFDTIVTFEDEVVPSVELGDVLFGRLPISLLFITFFLALAVGAAWLMVEGFMAVVIGRTNPCEVGCIVVSLLPLIELFPLLASVTFLPSVLLLFHCSLTSRKMKIIPQEGCMVLTSKFVSLYREPLSSTEYARTC